MVSCARLSRHTGVSIIDNMPETLAMCRWHLGWQACMSAELGELHRLLESLHQIEAFDEPFRTVLQKCLQYTMLANLLV